MMRLRAAALLIAAALLAGARLPAAQTPTLQPLGGIEALKAWFNANQGHPRIIFLLSPT